MNDDIVTRLRNSDGQGCTCGAYSYYECGCTEAVWAEMFINDAADEIERLRNIIKAYVQAEREYSNDMEDLDCVPIRETWKEAWIDLSREADRD